MEVSAKARRIRMSPKKVRLVANMVRGMDVSAAEAQLTFLNKAAARPVLKLIRSAKANAEHNFKLVGEDLYIKTIMVDGGPVMHRWMPRAFGRATPIKKRTSHITIVLDQRSAEGAPAEIGQAVVDKASNTGEEAPAKSSGQAKAEDGETKTKKKATTAKKTAEKKTFEVKTKDGKKEEGKKSESKSGKTGTKKAGGKKTKTEDMKKEDEPKAGQEQPATSESKSNSDESKSKKSSA